MKKTKLLIFLMLMALLFAGCGVSQEKLMKQGVYTELYSSDLLAEKIQNAVLSGDLDFQVTYFGSIEDLEPLSDLTWKKGYVNNRYVDYVEADYQEFKGYLIADYTVHTMEKHMLDSMPREDDGLAVFFPDLGGIDRCMTDMMGQRTDPARYLFKNTLAPAELNETLNQILYEYQHNSYAYPYMVSSLAWTVTSYDDVTELELDPVYREGAKNIGELPRVSTVQQYIEAVSDIWNENGGSDADVIMENLPLEEEEIFDALMIAEANAALIPCEADEVSYVQYAGFENMYVLSARLSMPFTAQDMAPLQDKLAAEIEETAQEIMAEYDRPKDRYRAAYRAVTEAAEYDEEVAEATEEQAVTEYMRILRSAYGALVEGSTVCTGYAKAYKALCDYMGLECIMINGTQDEVGHAWNMVMLEGVPYYVDCTYGDTGGGSEYCLFSAEELKERDYVIDREYSVYGLS